MNQGIFNSFGGSHWEDAPGALNIGCDQNSLRWVGRTDRALRSAQGWPTGGSRLATGRSLRGPVGDFPSPPVPGTSEDSELIYNIAPAISGTYGQRFSGGALTPNGQIIMSPAGANYALRVDLNNAGDYPGTSYPRISLMPEDVGSWQGHGHEFSDAILHPNGFIYLIPYYSHYMWAYDWRTLRLHSVTNISGPGGWERQWMGACLAPDGNIYCAPHGCAYMLCIEPGTGGPASQAWGGDSAYCAGRAYLWGPPFPYTSNGNYKCSGIICTRDGFGITIPGQDPEIYKVDFQHKTYKLIGSSGGSQNQSYNHWNAIEKPDGKIYMGPALNTQYITEVDPRCETVRTVGVQNVDGKKAGMAWCSDGMIHIAQGTDYTLGKIDMGRSLANDNPYMQTYVNSWNPGNQWKWPQLIETDLGYAVGVPFENGYVGIMPHGAPRTGGEFANKNYWRLNSKPWLKSSRNHR